MKKVVLFVPLAIFLILVGFLAAGFKLDDPHRLPSAMIDQPIAPFSLSELKDPDREITNADLKGEVSLLNVWATWCPNCLVEHPELMRISEEENVRMIGVNYNDERNKALKWLERHDSPYAFSIMDDEGKLGINLGVYGAPETYVVDADGVIRYRHVGVVSREVWEKDLEPLVDMLQEESVAER